MTNLQALLDFGAALSDAGIRWCIDGGTALAAYKQQSLFEDDKDIDTTMLHSQASKLPSALAAIKALGFRLAVERVHPRGSQQLTYRRETAIIDLMVKRDVDKWAWWSIYQSSSQGYLPKVYKRVPVEHYRKLGEVRLGEHMLPAPSKLEAYLTSRYGDLSQHKANGEYSATKDDLSIVPASAIFGKEASMPLMVYHPQYQSFFDRLTQTRFEPKGKPVRAAALVKRPEVIQSLVSRGFVAFPMHTGGGWYELSNGKRIRGADAALAAEVAL